MSVENIKDKKIEFFVDNGIDNYRRCNNITVKEMIDVYLGNDGFFILKDEKNNFVGYLDVSDLELIKSLFNNKSLKNKIIKLLIDSGEIKLRTEIVDSNESLINVLIKLNSSKQSYFPVLKNGTLIGRVSKKILKERIEGLY